MKLVQLVKHVFVGSLLIITFAHCERNVTDFGFDGSISGAIKDQTGSLVFGTTTSNNLIIQALGETDKVANVIRIKGDGTYQYTKLFPTKYRIWITGPATLVGDTVRIDLGTERIFKKDLVAYSKPEFNSFQLGIFGPQLEHIFTFYYILLVRLGLHIAAVKAVWHRASHYEELVTDPENAEAKVKREAYLYTNEDWFSDNSVVFRQPKPEKSGDKLVGLECKVEGPLAYVLMMGENGFQHWMHQGQTEFSPYLAQVVLDDEYSTPKRVHRLDFFTPKPRRIISPGNYTDKVYDIAAATEVELVAGIVHFCEDQMLREVDSAVG